MRYFEEQRVYKYSLDLNLLDVYANAMDAAEKNNIDNSQISRVIKSGKQYYNGYIWTKHGQKPTNKYINFDGKKMEVEIYDHTL